MNTSFFLTIIIAVISTAAFCFLSYLIFKWMIIKFQRFIKQMIVDLDGEDADETSACAMRDASDPLYNEMLMNELRKDALKAKTLKGKVVEFKIYDDPTKIKSNDIIFMQ